MWHNWAYLLALFLVFTGLPGKAKTTELLLVSQEYPPLQMEIGDQKLGYAIEFVREVVAEAAIEWPLLIKHEIFLPFTRALRTARTQANVLLFSISRTRERESAFYWIGTVAPYEMMLYQNASKPHIQLQSLRQLKGSGLTLGVNRGSNLHELLRDSGICYEMNCDEVQLVNHGWQNISKLAMGRLDLLAHPTNSFSLRIRQQGYNDELFHPVLRIDELSKELWLVLSKASDPKLADLLKHSLEKLKRNGRLTQLQRVYSDDDSWQQDYLIDHKLKSK